MSRLLFFLFSLLSCSLLISQTVWEHDFGLPDSTFAIDIQETADGNFLLYGGTYQNSPEPEAFLLKFTEDGEEVWLNFYDINPSFSYSHVGSPVSYPSGNLFISSLGNIVISGDNTVGLDSEGNMLWEHDFGVTDLAQFSNGEMLAVDHSHLRRLNTEGLVLSMDSIGLGRNSCLDSAWVLNSVGPVPEIPAYDTYSQIEIIGDSLIIMSGMFLDNEGTEFGSLWNGSVVQIIRASSMETMYINRENQDILPSHLPPQIERHILLNTSSDASPSYTNMTAEIPVGRFIDKGLLANNNWSSSSQLFYIFLSDSTGYDLVPASIKLHNDEYVISTRVSQFGEDHSTIGSGIARMDNNENILSLNELFIGGNDIPDLSQAFCISEAGNFFLSGKKDDGTSLLPSYHLEAELQGTFYVARIDSLQYPFDIGNISGTVFQNPDGNAYQGWDEGGFPHMRILLNGEYAGYTNDNGMYQVFLQDTGAYEITLDSWLLDSLSYTVNTQYPATVDMNVLRLGQDYANFGIDILNDIPVVNLAQNCWSINPGFEFNVHGNTSCIFPLGADSIIYTLDYPDFFTSHQMSTVDDISDNGDILTWKRLSSTNFPYWQEQHSFIAELNLPTELEFLLIAEVFTSGVSTVFTDLLSVNTSGAFDPNDKLVAPAGIGPEGLIPSSTDRLTYTIRFQNTGSDSTHFIRIVDVIDTTVIDANGFQMLASSHPDYSLSYKGNKLEWNFDPIQLPDSTTDPLGSQGFIQFSIALRDDLMPGDLIENSASIYFDFNEAIVTEAVRNTLILCPSMTLASDSLFSCGPGPITLSGVDVSPLALVEWSSNGTGSFNDNSLAAPIYTPSESDLASGQAVLTIDLIGDSLCPAVSEEIIVSFFELPIVVLEELPSVVCDGADIQIVFEASNVLDISWSGEGVFTESGTSVVYSPSESEVNDGVAIFSYTAEGLHGSCTGQSESISIALSSSIEADLIAQVAYCTDDLLVAENLSQGGITTWLLEGYGEYTQSEAPEILFTQAEDLWLHLEVEDTLCFTVSEDSLWISITELPEQPIIQQFGNSLNTTSIWYLQWYLNGASILDANELTLDISTDGIYTVEAINELCSSFSDDFSAILSSLTDLVRSGQVQLTTLPGRIQVTWLSELGLEQVNLLDAKGQLLASYHVDMSTREEIDISTLSTGTYLIMFKGENGLLGTHKLVVH